MQPVANSLNNVSIGRGHKTDGGLNFSDFPLEFYLSFPAFLRQIHGSTKKNLRRGSATDQTSCSAIEQLPLALAQTKNDPQAKAFDL